MLMLKAIKPALTNPIWWVGVGAFLFFGSLAIASSGVISPTEVNWLVAIYDWPSFLTPLLMGITYLGSIWAVLTLALFYIWKRKRIIASHLVLSASFVYLLSAVTKVLVNRPRPAVLFGNITQREVFINTDLGFPSAHTAVSAAMALMLLAVLPKNRRFVVPLWIILVGLSRIHLGVHAPLDVVGGAGLGLMVAGFINFTIKGKGFTGKLHKRKLEPSTKQEKS